MYFFPLHERSLNPRMTVLSLRSASVNIVNEFQRLVALCYIKVGESSITVTQVGFCVSHTTLLIPVHTHTPYKVYNHLGPVNVCDCGKFIINF